MIREIEATEFLSSVAMIKHKEHPKRTIHLEIREMQMLANNVEYAHRTLRINLTPRSIDAFGSRDEKNIVIEGTQISIHLGRGIIKTLKRGSSSVSDERAIRNIYKQTKR